MLRRMKLYLKQFLQFFYIIAQRSPASKTTYLVSGGVLNSITDDRRPITAQHCDDPVTH